MAKTTTTVENELVSTSMVIRDYEDMIATLDEILNYMEGQNAADNPAGYELTFCSAIGGIIVKHDNKLRHYIKGE